MRNKEASPKQTNNTQHTNSKHFDWKRLLPLIIIILALALAYYFRLYDYLSFETIKNNRQALLTWTNNHYFLLVIGFMAVYIIATALSLPGAVFLTLTSGFLFGVVLGTVYVVISATIGATVIFMAVQWSLGEWLADKATSWIATMREGFQRDAFQYLLFLRLVPIFPFWVVNIVPALLNVKRSQFIIATGLGIMPGSLVYVMIGNGLGHLLDQGKQPNLGIIFEPQILLPLVGLGILALIPTVYKQIKKRRHDDGTE